MSAAGTQHTVPPEERRAFVDFTNSVLENDELVGSRIPINPDNDDFYAACGDGYVLCKLLGKCIRNSMDEKKITIKDELNTFEKQANCSHFVTSCAAAGVKVVNVDGSDIVAGKPHLIMGLVWQTIKMGIFSRVYAEHPELVLLLEPGRPAADLLELGDEEVVIRWVNWHLKRVKSSHAPITNFGSDIQDAKVYAHLVHSLGLVEDVAPLLEMDPAARAAAVLEACKAVKCNRFVTPKDIVDGRVKLNFAFSSLLFTTDPKMPPLPDAYCELAGEHVKLQEQVAEGEQAKADLAALQVEHKLQGERLEGAKAEVAAEYAAKEAAWAAKEAEMAKQLEETQMRLEFEEERAIVAEAATEQVAVEQAHKLECEKGESAEKLAALEKELADLKGMLQAKIDEATAAAAAASMSKEEMEKLRAGYGELSGKLDSMSSKLEQTEEERRKALARANNAQSAFDQLHGMFAAQKEGWAAKQGRSAGAGGVKGMFTKKFKKRWFSLRGRLLFYFLSDVTAKQQKPLGLLYLDEYEIDPSSEKNLIKLKHKKIQPPAKGSTFDMQCDSVKDKAEWIEWIEKARQDPTFALPEDAQATAGAAAADDDDE